MFLNAVNTYREVKNKHYIAEKVEDCIKEVEAQNVIQIKTGKASACKVTGAIVESKYPHIFWSYCVMHTINLILKNICAANKTETNVVTYA